MLAGIVGDRHLIGPGGDFEPYVVDWRGRYHGKALAVVKPGSTQEVSGVVKACAAAGIAIVPQGGNTGMCGAATPLGDRTMIVLRLDRLDKIRSISRLGDSITVDAGCILADIQKAADEIDRLFPLSLGAEGSCQIGGNLSTNAGGTAVLRYGTTRELTLGLEVVLPDGEILDGMTALRKDSTGFDTKQLFIGAEGTLGVITRAVLRLHPAPRAKATVLVAVGSFEQSLSLLGRLQARFPGAVAAFELMWRDFVAASLQWQSLREPFDAPHPFAALVDVTGSDEDELRAAIEELLGESMEAGEALDAVIAQSQAQARALWKIREATAELPAHMHPPINFDVSLPMAEIGRFADTCRAALDARWPGNIAVFFGHVGDSNLHLSVDASTVGGDEHGVEQLVYDQVARFGGSVSAEHGIGTHKKPYLGASRTPAELAAMRAIKQALDPHHLMNPGKLFDRA